MEEKPVVNVILVSGACCAPQLARLDAALEKNLEEAMGSVDAVVQVDGATLSSVLAGKDNLPAKMRDQMLALFQRHGTSFTPAVIINDKVRFAGSRIATVAQLKEALEAVAASA